MNRFIIDEEAECEVIKVIELTKRPEFEFSEIILFRKFQNLFSYSKLMTICELLYKSPLPLSSDDPNMQIHFLFALSFEFELFFFFLPIPYYAHCSYIWNRSKSFLSDKDLESFYHGSANTIGDDIDFFIEKFENMKPNPYIWELKIVYQTLISHKILKLLHFFVENVFDIDILYNKLNQEFEYLTISKKSEDSFLNIQCKRKFIPRQMNRWISLVLAFIIYLLSRMAWEILNVEIQKIFNLLQYPFYQGFPISFCFFWMLGLGALFIELSFFHQIVEIQQNFIFFVETLLTILLPNTWVRIVNIVNPLFLCVYFYVCYIRLCDVTRSNFCLKTLLKYFQTSFVK